MATAHFCGLLPIKSKKDLHEKDYKYVRMQELFLETTITKWFMGRLDEN